MSDTLSVLDAWLALRGLSRAEIERGVLHNEGQTDENVSYQRLLHLTRRHNAAVHPGYFYFCGEQLAVLYISNSDVLLGLTPSALFAQFGDATLDLASRAGKRARMYVYAERGVAFSAEQSTIQFLEIFPPCSAEKYQSNIYLAPGTFNE